MSDFIFSSKPKPRGELSSHLQSIYHKDAPGVSEYHGRWGSLAVSQNLYNGFQPYETADHIAVVIGGPVLCFQDNRFLIGDDPVAGTQAIFQRWHRGAMQWDEDLSGPFAILMIDKYDSQLICTTDLMLFIPVYQCQIDDEVMLGTHVDVLARAADQSGEFDQVSLADFILHHVVTYPYTAYKAIRQCHPAATQVYRNIGQNKISISEFSIYWAPVEDNPYENIGQGALALRQGLQDYVERVTDGMSRVAQFISGGEDSRALAGLLPKKLERDAFVFLDSMNREGHIAKAVAEIYEATFQYTTRGKYHYLDIMPEAVDLIGSGQQYFHAHVLGFHKTCQLSRYPAVFGGYLSDSLLKAVWSRKIRGHRFFPFVPSFFLSGETRTRQVNHKLFSTEVLNAITQRRRAHLNNVQKFRRLTDHEWFVLWPATMRVALTFIHSNRRLFRSYEPFLAKDVIKISAAVPTSWKLNRRLFNKAMRPYLRPSRWMLHADGHLPYFPWWINIPVQFSVLVTRHIAGLLRPYQGAQGPWSDFDQIIAGQAWQQAIERYTSGFKHLDASMFRQELKRALNDHSLNAVQKFNLMQVVYELSKKK